jgi:hypothetical protein
MNEYCCDSRINPRGKKSSGRSFIIGVAALFLLIPFFYHCSLKTTPSKVWGLRGKIVDLAESLMGTSYKYGGTDIDGFDCSGLIFYIYDCFGIKLPRTAKKQRKAGRRTSFAMARPADILIFKINGNWHSGILVDQEYFVHAPTRNSRIRKEYLSKFWLSRLKRVITIIKD